MKKILYMVSVLLMLLIMPITALAEENMIKENLTDMSSSQYVSDEIKNSLELTDTDVVVKIYNCPVIIAFGESSSLEDVIRGKHILEISYAVLRETTAQWQHYDVYETPVEINDSSLNYTSKTLAMINDKNAMKNVVDSATVKDAYYFYNPTAHQGTVIYYKTDKGDFVYYDYIYDRYWFTAEDFFDFMKEVLSQMGPDTPPGGFDITSVRDLSQYDINSPNFYLKANPQQGSQSENNVTNNLSPVGNNIEATQSGMIKPLMWTLMGLGCVAILAGAFGTAAVLRKKKQRH